ncbi:pilus assembly protein [Paenibacillus spiritus]|uniref:Pilus assembly protein n=1 Tax=Paenibacillus spiritus TaxID=2496557 RepID=A0A5J5GAT4_9BACL|nr:pilus assembly protein [Paenibacillus spiritus]KAA9004922.1 pilus assembly protein [Paenibacillus spiritus]
MGHMRRRLRRLSETEGVLVVEAAMLMPFFLLFVLFLIFMVQMTLYSTALQSTVSDTVKMTSAHWYPVNLALEERRGTNQPAGTNRDAEKSQAGRELNTGQWTVPRLSMQEWAGAYVSALPSPLKEWVREAIERGEGPLQRVQAESTEAVLDQAVKPLMKPYLASDLLDFTRLHISNITIPGAEEGQDAYFGIQASYALPMQVPFIHKRIVLEASAMERVWIGNREGASGEDKPPDSTDTIRVLSVPDPAYPGSKGKIRIRLAPNASANLTIYYKSGKSVAKYLGWKNADKDGFIEWEWIVGGNTTPDTWPEFRVESQTGAAAEGRFRVMKKPGRAP